MKITFCGAAKEVTGSCFFIETSSKKIVVDCGMFQGSKEQVLKNWDDFPFDAKEIDFVLISHSHLDHIGRLPKMYKEGLRGKVFMTAPALDFMKIFLEDSIKLLNEDVRNFGKPPLYEIEDIKGLESLCSDVFYEKEIDLGDNIFFKFYDAGHILGSSIIELKAEGKVLIFSGDLGNPPVPLLKPTKMIDNADFVFLESTYGDKIHEDVSFRKVKLERAVEDAATKKGVLLVPAFAMERTQELLYEFNELVENKRVPQMPIFIDSPLAIKATEIYKKYPEFYNKEAAYLIKSGDDIFKFPGLSFTRTGEESKEIKGIPSPKVVTAGSGMSTGGRILFHEKLYLSDPNTIFLVIGYQAEGTLGRRIFDIGHGDLKEKTVIIDGQEVEVNAEVRAIGAYSAHADQPKLIKWVSNIKGIKKVFVVHGEEKSANGLAQMIKDELKLEAMVPEMGEGVEI